MSIELRPIGVKCNLQCRYCYQNPQREAGNVEGHYDLEKMKVALEKAGKRFTLFGGEPLLVADEDLEAIWSWGYEKYGRNSIQTNGTRITENHIRMFKAYKVSVGISMDGPEALNDIRWAGSLKKTRKQTARAMGVIERLCKEGIPTSLIVTLHRGNAAIDKLPLMRNWYRFLVQIGIRHVRLHLLEVENESIRSRWGLSPEENLAAMRWHMQLEGELNELSFDLFSDMRNMLSGKDDKTTCLWGACDPYTTSAVQGIEGDGRSSNCGRTNKDGIDFVKSAACGYERYLALYYTPQAHGGCKDCRFFLACKGECPGTAIGGDWRNRTVYCSIWKELYGDLEAEMIRAGDVPVSQHPERKRIEAIFLSYWEAGRRTYMKAVLQQFNNHSPKSG